MTKEDSQERILDDLRHCLNWASEHVGTNKSLEDSQVSITHILKKYKNVYTNSPLVLSILTNIDFLNDSIIELKTVNKKSAYLINKITKINKKIKHHELNEIPVNTMSIKLFYVLRMALDISISGFIIDVFDINQGRWMMFTFLYVVISIYE